MSDLNARAQRGVKLLLVRRVVMQAVALAGGIILARVLSPTEYGIFGIANVLIQMSATFGDVGLAASLIQRRQEITDRDLQVGFTVQQALTAVIVVGLYVAAPFLQALYPKSPPETVWLIRLLSLTLFLNSWRATSVLQLERQLRFERIAPAEIFEALVYQGGAVLLAIAGFGIWSFAIAGILRGVVGTMIMYFLAPWPVRLTYDRKVARELLQFGVPFQLSSAINIASSWTPALLGGALFGPQAVGLLNWAYQNTRPPSVLLESMTRVSFAHFARLQDDREAFEQTMVRYLTVMLLGSGIFAALVLAIGGPVALLIFSHKWEQGVTALCIYSIGVCADALTLTLVNAQSALGLVRLTMRRAIVRVLLNFAISAALIPFLGFNGIAVGAVAAMIVTIPLCYQGLGSGVMARTLSSIAWLAIPFATSILIGRLLLFIPVPLLLSIGLAGSGAGIVFAVCCYLFGPAWLRSKIRRYIDRLVVLIPRSAKVAGS